VLAVMASLSLAAPCRAAGLIIQAPNLSVLPGSSGAFDMLLINTNPAGGASYDVSADSLDLSLSGSAGVTFEDVTIKTIPPYIYKVSATTLPGSNPLNFGISFPNTGFMVADSDGASPFFQTVNPRGRVWPGTRPLQGQPHRRDRQHGHDHDRQCRRWHLAVGRQSQFDLVHTRERLDHRVVGGPRTRDADGGCDRRVVGPGRFLVAPERTGCHREPSQAGPIRALSVSS
jgi:hypothetical protein